jgi:response regulator RpfG family c-di-GMP phosphodiesterase
LGYEEAAGIIMDAAGKEFDPQIVEVFKDVHQDFLIIAEKDKQKTALAS